MSSTPVRLSLPSARRIALAAQGFNDAPPTGRIDRRHLQRVLDRVGLVQIDSVNIVARNHDLPLYARIGDHPRNALVSAAHRGEVFEYWGHEASFIPVALHPLLRHRMAAAEAGAAWSGLVKLAERQPRLIEDVYDEVLQRGPLAAGQLSMAEGRKGPWWGWNDTKMALEWLFWCGRLAARRRANFEREYGAPGLFVPAEVLALPSPDPDEQRRRLLLVAARCLGVGTASDLADYFRLKMPVARPLLEQLVDDGALLSAEVEGWRHRCYLWPEARSPRRVAAQALLSPFDSLVWERDRTERLFGFRYRLEFYTPAPRRTYGYYVMPFLLGEQIPARVDLKADRKARCLLVLGAFLEAELGRLTVAEIAAELAAQLRRFAAFLDLDEVRVVERGDLAPALRAAVGSSAEPDAAAQP